jgi:DNA-binding MarR family transcriptional regulator
MVLYDSRAHLARPLNLDPSICNNAAVRRAARRLGLFYDLALSRTGVKSTQYAVLRQILRLGFPSPSQLADALVMDRSALSRTLRALEQLGLIDSVPGQFDARFRQIRLTTNGRDKIAECDLLWAKAQRVFEAAYGDASAHLRISLDQIAGLPLALFR